MPPLPPESPIAGAPELTELGKRIEMLRITRGLSKQHLARHVGASRQQLWRVMTGKSELSAPMRARLADALHVDAGSLTPSSASASTVTTTPTPTSPSALDLRHYLADARAVARTLASLPTGDEGRALKRRLLDALEDAAIQHGVEIDAEVFQLRRRVLSGDL